MSDFLRNLPQDAVDFKARDVISTETTELNFDQVFEAVDGYKGKGFEEIENVENLGLVEYLQRLKADRGRYLGNIVHQGVRDHHGMAEHSVGLGEYDCELELIIKSGGLISTIGKALKNEGELKKAAAEIRKSVADGALVSEAIDDYIYRQHEAGAAHDMQGLTDDLAVHMSTNYIIDVHYGAETGNECFIVLPEKVGLKDKIFFGKAQDSGSRHTQYNDVYIWPSKDESNDLKINGTLLFLPRDNQVDVRTGSTYEVVGDKVVVDTQKIDRVSDNIGKIKELKPDWVMSKDEGGFSPSFEELLKRGYIKLDSKNIYQVTTAGQSNIGQDFWGQFDQYIKAVVEAGITDIQTFERFFSHYPESVNSEKEKILSAVDPKDREFLEQILNQVLKTSRSEDLRYGFESIFNPSQFKKEYLPKFREVVRKKGIDPEKLEEILKRNNILQLAERYFSRYTNYYQSLADKSYGIFYKKPENKVRSKDYYHNFICQRLKDVKITTVQAGKQDIVEYRGVNEKGEAEVVRVVFYSAKDPNTAVEGFYYDMSIKFDSTILGENGVGNTDYAGVKYSHDVDLLKSKLLTMVQA